MALTMYNYRETNREKSSPAIWAKPEEIAQYSSGCLQDDIILGHDASVAYYDRNKSWEHGVNSNVFCFGGTGGGKTRSVAEPNLANHLDCSYVVTDPKGELLRDMGPGFEKDGYKVQVLNAIDLSKSAGYDPFRNIGRPEDIPTVVTSLFDAVTPNRRNTHADTIWENTAEIHACGCAGILWDLEHVDGCFSPKGDPSAERKYLRMNRFFDLMKLATVSEANDGEDKSPLDYLAEGVENGGIEYSLFAPQPDAYGPSKLRACRTSAAKTHKSILISEQSHIAKLDTPEMRRIFEHDEMRLDDVGDDKRVIFLLMSDCDSTKSVLPNVFIKQLLMKVERKADAAPNGRLKVPLTFVLDEFPNIGRIPDFDRVIATARSRGMNFLLCAQSISQLDDKYGPAAARTILDNCDTVVYMGSGSSLETARYISELCGQYDVATEYVGAEHAPRKIRDWVITPTEVSLLPRTDCLVKISGCRPFRTKKFGVHEHPNYQRFVTQK